MEKDIERDRENQKVIEASISGLDEEITRVAQRIREVRKQLTLTNTKLRTERNLCDTAALMQASGWVKKGRST